MIVKLREQSPDYPDLTPDQPYVVLGIEADDLRILNDQGRPYLYQRELVAGNPKVYGQLVKILSPYTRVLKEPEGALATAARALDAGTPDATQAFVDAAAPAAAPAAPVRKPVRIRKADAAKDGDAPF